MTRFLCLFFLLSCAMIPLTRQPLLDQELRFRPQGLTNQLCTTFKDSKCEVMDTVIYDLALQETRDRLIAVKLVCNVAGKRFRVMRSEPCLYSTYEKVKRIIGIPVKRELIIDEKLCMPEKLQDLMDKKTFCAPFGSVSERGMKWN